MSLSSLQREAICAASAVFPRVGSWSFKANGGSAIHEVIAARISGAEPDEAQLENIADVWSLVDAARDRFFYLARTFRPRIPDGALAEVALGLFDDGSVRPVEGARGEYENAPGLVQAGTIDVLWNDGGTTWVVDFKAGEDRYVPPVAMNWQVRGGAALAAKWLGTRSVIPAICFVDGAKVGEHQSEGRWEVGTPLGPVELQKIESEIVAIAGRVAEAKERGVGHQDMVTGPQCEYCPCRSACPAHVDEVRSLVATGTDTPRFLSIDEASKLAGLLPRMRKIVAAVEKSLKAHVDEHGPVPLVDGKVFGPQAGTKIRLATRPTYQAIYEHLRKSYEEVELPAEETRTPDQLAAEAADAAFKTSKKAISEAIGMVHDDLGIVRKKSAATRSVLSDVNLSGGVTTIETTTYRNHWPGGKAEEDEDE